jgi:hypothetical protein
MQKAIYIPLRMAEAEALVRLAREQDRRPRDQAARLLRKALRDEGVLEPEPDPRAGTPVPAEAR